MTYLKTLARAAGLGLCVAALSGTALADPGKGNGNAPATPPGQEKKAETPAPAPAPAAPATPAPASQAAPGQEKKAEKQEAKSAKKAEPKPAAQAVKPAKADKPAAAKAKPDKPAKAAKAKPDKPAKAAKPATTSGSYKNTSRGTDLKKGMAHKHTICHATGSSSNPFVRITPSVSGVFNGHIGHQGSEDIIPPFVYKGTTYSQNWDAEGQALFNAGCAAPAASTPLTPVTPSKDKKNKVDCPASSRTTERVLVGVWHATGAVKNGQRKFVFITPSLNSAHYDASKHPDDIPVYEERTVSVAGSAESCGPATPSAQNLTPPTSNTVPQPIVPTAAGQTPTPGAIGVLPAVTPAPAGGVAGAVSPAPRAEKKPAGGVLGAIASAPEAVADTATSGTLPFTGIPLWIAALIGGALLATGLVLRRSS